MFHEYRSGLKRYVYEGFVKLNIYESQYEYIEYNGFWKDTLNFFSNWEWLDTYFSKTHIKIRLDFNSNNGYLSSYAIIELNDSVFRVERIYQAYSNYLEKIQLTFKKSEEDGNVESNTYNRIIQNPSIILGTWKLVEYEEIISDSTFSKYLNDTLIAQFYSEYGHNPITKVKEFNKYYCS